jgi:hypothetical protein
MVVETYDIDERIGHMTWHPAETGRSQERNGSGDQGRYYGLKLIYNVSLWNNWLGVISKETISDRKQDCSLPKVKQKIQI